MLDTKQNCICLIIFQRIFANFISKEKANIYQVTIYFVAITWILLI